MYPYARTIYSQHLTGRMKVLYEREADVATFSQKSTNRNSAFHYSDIKNLESILQET